VSGDALDQGGARALAGLTDRRARSSCSSDDEVSWKSLRNLAEVHLLAADQLNTYDVLCATTSSSPPPSTRSSPGRAGQASARRAPRSSEQTEEESAK
jgi:large subunit ribosomal protein L4